MKKITLILTAFLFLAVISFAHSGGYDSATEKMTVHFTKGWNLYPILGGEEVGNDCRGTEEKGGPPIYIYLYSPLSKKYMLVGDIQQIIAEEQQKYGVSGKQYLYPYGAWFYYSHAECDGWITWKKGGINPFLDIAAGWQFVNKLPFMSNYATTFEKCQIEKFNQWDNDAKKWKFMPSKTSSDELKSLWDNAPPGEVFVIKFASDCTLGWSATPSGPPSLE